MCTFNALHIAQMEHLATWQMESMSTVGYYWITAHWEIRLSLMSLMKIIKVEYNQRVYWTRWCSAHHSALVLVTLLRHCVCVCVSWYDKQEECSTPLNTKLQQQFRRQSHFVFEKNVPLLVWAELQEGDLRQAWIFISERARPFSFRKGQFHWKILKSMGNFWRGK